MKLKQKILNLFKINLLEAIPGLQEVKKVIFTFEQDDFKKEVDGYVITYKNTEYYVFSWIDFPNYIRPGKHKQSFKDVFKLHQTTLIVLKSVDTLLRKYSLYYYVYSTNLRELLLRLGQLRHFEKEYGTIILTVDIKYKIKSKVKSLKIIPTEKETKQFVDNIIHYIDTNPTIKIVSYRIVDSVPKKAELLPKKLNKKQIFSSYWYTSTKVYFPIYIDNKFNNFRIPFKNKWLEFVFSHNIHTYFVNDMGRAQFYLQRIFKKEKFSNILAKVLFKYRHIIFLNYNKLYAYQIPKDIFLLPDENIFVEHLYYTYIRHKHKQVLKQLLEVEQVENMEVEEDLNYYFAMEDWDKYWERRTPEIVFNTVKEHTTEFPIYIYYNDGTIIKIE